MAPDSRRPGMLFALGPFRNAGVCAQPMRDGGTYPIRSGANVESCACIWGRCSWNWPTLSYIMPLVRISFNEPPAKEDIPSDESYGFWHRLCGPGAGGYVGGRWASRHVRRCG